MEKTKPQEGNITTKKMLLIIIVLVVWVSVSVANFISNANSFEEQTAQATLMADTENNAAIAQDLFDSYIDVLETVAYGATHFYYYEFETTQQESIFNDFVMLHDFSRIGIVMPNGESYCSNGVELKEGDYAFTDEMRLGATHVSNVFYDEEVGANVVSVNVPVHSSEGVLLAYFVGILSTEDLSIIFQDYNSSINSSYYIIDAGGSYVADNLIQTWQGDKENLYEVLDRAVFEQGYSAENFTNVFKDRQSAIVEYSLAGEPRIAYVSAVDINNWVIINVIDENTVIQNSRRHISNGLLFILSILFAIGILLYAFYTTQKKINENARIYERNFALLSEQINKVIFEWDVERGDLKLTGNFEQIFKRKPIISNWPVDAIAGDMIDKKDKLNVIHAATKIKKGENVSDIIFKIKLENDEYVWSSMTCMPIRDEETGNVIKAIGVFENIDASMRASLELKEKSEIDSLAGIYNKGTTEFKIKEIVNNSAMTTKTHTLFIIDLDNFKDVNDKLGHIFGDKVINELATELKNMFRSFDIVGRIGGDEFFAFMRDMSDISDIEKKAEKIIQTFDKTYESNGVAASISASIGIAVYPTSGKDFDTLYKNADIALYETKKKGKDGYTIYTGQTHRGYVSNRTAIESNTEETIKDIL